MSDKVTLRALVEQSTEVEQMLIESHGEITPEIEEALKVIDLRLPEKVDSYSMVMDRMSVISEFYKGRAELFLKLAKAADNVTDFCKTNLKTAMVEMGVEEILGNDIKFKLVNSNPSVVIEDEKAIDPSYKIIKTTESVDKKRVAEDLKLGVPVKGASLQENKSLRQYANKPGK